MKRRLVWVCGGVVAIVILVRLGAASAGSGAESPQSSATARPAPPTPAPACSPELRQLRERMLRDDSLAPPPANASPEVLRAYQETLAAIERGKDPLLELKSLQEVQAETTQRLEERKKAAQEHRKKEQEKANAVREAKKKERDEKRLQSQGRPVPPPLAPPPKLGPPVTGIEEPKKP